MACTYTPQQNGFGQRMDCTLLDMFRPMMTRKSVPKSCWGEAVVAAAYHWDRLTSQSISKFTTLFQVLFGVKPDLTHLEAFGLRCWYSYLKEGPKKIGARGTETILIVYSQNQKPYKLGDPRSQSWVQS